MKEFNVNCSKAFDHYIALDKHERVPFPVMVHLVFCPVCRAAVRQMAAAETLLLRPLSVQSTKSNLSDDPVLSAALDKIAAAGLAYPVRDPVAKRVSLLRWFLAGILLAGGFALFPFTSSGIWMQAEFGKALVVPFYILCGCAVTAYGGLFVGTNIDLFVKRFKTLKTGF